MRWASAKEWVYQVVISIDQLVNALLAGMADETMSSRIYRLNHRQPYKTLEKIVDALFWPFQGRGHCKGAYLKELSGRQLGFDRAWEMNK